MTDHPERHRQVASAPLALIVLLAATALTLLAPSLASATGKRALVTVQTVKVGATGNPSVGVIPFKDAIYESCADAPPSKRGCVEVGDVDYSYGIGQLEITVEQWVAFLNTVDPDGRNRRHLYARTQSSSRWPEYGQVNRSRRTRKGKHYSVASQAWADKPYGFASFLSAARFVNSLYNGRLLSKRRSPGNGFEYARYKVRLSPRTERGMYDLRQKKATRSAKRGFVVPSQNEWMKAAYYDPDGGGTLPWWKYPTNPGVFGDQYATAPSRTELDFSTGDVTNAGEQPLANYRVEVDGVPPSEQAPTWCPPAAQTGPEGCSMDNPFGIDPDTYEKAYLGNVAGVGQALTTSPWGTLDQGGNAVEWTDTITPPPAGKSKRVWRRLHGGISNAPGIQMWPSAVGLQPQNNAFFDRVYPWLGFRIGVIGNLKVKR